MSDDNELLPPPLSWRFGDGRPRGAKNLIQRQLREEVQAYLAEHGPRANPLLVLLHLAQHANSEAVRERAASDALKVLLPAQVLTQREPEESDGPGSTIIVEALASLLHPAPESKQIQGSSSHES
jgi:hypothetical protein